MTEYWERLNTSIDLLYASFQNVETRSGWRITEESGLETFNSSGFLSGRFDGQDNFFSGRMASRESGARWEIDGDKMSLFGQTGLLTAQLRGGEEGLLLDGPVAFQGDGSFSIVPSAGWSVYSAHDSYLTVSNGIATLRATMLISAGGSFGSILTVPPLACPGKSVFGGTFHSTGTARGQLYITPDGVLSSPASYREGALAAGGYLPVAASWRVG